MTEKQGTLVCVGPGVIVGAHISIRCQKHIEQADVVFVNSHPIMLQWIETMNTDVRSLQHFYGEGKDRRITYQEMIDAILDEVRQGKRVVGVFYGHPGVFAKVPHKSIAQARKEGFRAVMEPGISAEDCLYADMGIDPGDYGCQHYEASQFLFYNRRYDPSAYLILWQIALAGDITIAKRLSSPEERQFLVDMLKKSYPGTHKVALYESPTLITDAVREEWIALDELPTADLTPVTTLVIPPCEKMVKDEGIVGAIRALSLPS
ncbi:SAM-dependent methyltransferase [Alteromonas halophila]|uniref:Tetrapyrrole methylase domain-containing protein n=1 Tax=Alteromonas halophila TaxID=516698 RepID=A0A918JFZ9_9ALTE|nr:SAM-dependent methyltransferase [Alteromonas halophila]GGW77100.1 hypothetical protein GCM10007391_07530 [Alteromonas halophila]